jgi:type II secretion system protein N
MSMLDAIRERMNPATLLDAVRGFEFTRRGLLVALAYFLYGVVVFAVVFAAKYAVLNADALIREAVARQDAFTVEFSRFEPQILPPRVVLDHLRVLDKKTGQPLLLMGETDLRLSVLPLLVGKVGVSLTSRMYGGVVEADLATGVFFNTDVVNADISLDMVELERIPQVRAYDKSLKGFASVTASLHGEWASPLSMEAELTGRLAQLDMENRVYVVKGARLTGYEVDLDCALNDGVLRVRRLDLSGGDGISLKTEGDIAVNDQDFLQSKLDMTGKFLGPPEALATRVIDPKALAMLRNKQAVNVAVTGTPANPAAVLK